MRKNIHVDAQKHELLLHIGFDLKLGDSSNTQLFPKHTKHEQVVFMPEITEALPGLEVSGCSLSAAMQMDLSLLDWGRIGFLVLY